MASSFRSLEVVRHRLESVAETMGITLRRSAFSPNIKERLDFSCAVFDSDGRLLAQAAHIPVHLGAMPDAVAAARRSRDEQWRPGDVVVLNDPAHGGSHLPDLTTVSPVFRGDREAGPDPTARPIAFLAARAHHADIGGPVPGSMGSAVDIHGEGLVIPPVLLADRDGLRRDVIALICSNTRTPEERRGDLQAQLAAHSAGDRRMRTEIIDDPAEFRSDADRLLDWSEQLARGALGELPRGVFRAHDAMEDDGMGGGPYPIRVAISLPGDGTIDVDFSGTAGAAPAGINAPSAVTRAAVRYVVACLLDEDVPLNDGAFATVSVRIPPGCLLDPPPGAAVAAGNVETSQRIVDVMLNALTGALPDRVPASSQGTMNNVLAGGRRRDGTPWAYYETLGGGAGASREHRGMSGRQVHMTNTRNTPVEELEAAIPVRVVRYAVRRGSGGRGARRGGDGIIRTYRFLAPAHVTVISERRSSGPRGASGGQDGAPGRNLLFPGGSGTAPLSTDGATVLPAKTRLDVSAGDVLHIETPGGGGWGVPNHGIGLGADTGGSGGTGIAG